MAIYGPGTYINQNDIFGKEYKLKQVHPCKKHIIPYVPICTCEQNHRCGGNTKKLEKKIDKVSKKVDNIQNEIVDIDNRIEYIEQHTVDTYTKSEIDGIQDNLLAQIDNIKVMVDTYTKTEIDDKLTTMKEEQSVTDTEQDIKIDEMEDVEIKWQEYDDDSI